jgi:hypothetical protein
MQVYQERLIQVVVVEVEKIQVMEVQEDQV